MSVQTPARAPRARKTPASAASKSGPVAGADDDWDAEPGDSAEHDVEWLEMAAREKESSRIRLATRRSTSARRWP